MAEFAELGVFYSELLLGGDGARGGGGCGCGPLRRQMWVVPQLHGSCGWGRGGSVEGDALSQWLIAEGEDEKGNHCAVGLNFSGWGVVFS